jgi:copper homeostasis protein
VNLDAGGTTPGTTLIAAVLEQLQIPVFVLVRPRAGDFVYPRAEIDAMLRDIGLAGSMGIAGIVTGALDRDGQVDVERTRDLVRAAGKLPVTFHRAIDAVVDQSLALEQVIEAGASRILTSGAAPTALKGAGAIGALVVQAGERISIVAAGSIREHNARGVIARTRVGEIHARLVDESRMRKLIEVVRSGDC